MGEKKRGRREVRKASRRFRGRGRGLSPSTITAKFTNFHQPTHQATLHLIDLWLNSQRRISLLEELESEHALSLPSSPSLCSLSLAPSCCFLCLTLSSLSDASSFVRIYFSALDSDEASLVSLKDLQNEREVVAKTKAGWIKFELTFLLPSLSLLPKPINSDPPPSSSSNVTHLMERDSSLP